MWLFLVYIGYDKHFHLLKYFLFVFLCSSPIFGQSDMDKLGPHVDGFSLMTYDYSTAGRLEQIQNE